MRLAWAACLFAALIVPLKAHQSIVSADLLRHPLNGKARKILMKAIDAMEAGEHADAIRILEETLAKYPDSAAWTQSLLGVEYVRMDRYDDAVTSFDQAVQLLPHDAVNRYNLGLALVLAVHYDRAEEELRTALKLNHSNANAKKLLDALIDRRIAQSRE